MLRHSRRKREPGRIGARRRRADRQRAGFAGGDLGRDDRGSGRLDEPTTLQVISRYRNLLAVEDAFKTAKAVRDTTGADIPGYFHIWRWILPKLTSAERGGKKTNPKPGAILKYAHTPSAMPGGLWNELRCD